MQPFAPLGRDLAHRGQTCSYSPGDTDATDCPDKATWHIMWTAEGDVGLACDPHMDVARRRFVFADSHRIGADCAMPGAFWDFDNRRCIVPDEPAAKNTAAEEPATA